MWFDGFGGFLIRGRRVGMQVGFLDIDRLNALFAIERWVRSCPLHQD